MGTLWISHSKQHAGTESWNPGFKLWSWLKFLSLNNIILWILFYTPNTTPVLISDNFPLPTSLSFPPHPQYCHLDLYSVIFTHLVTVAPHMWHICECLLIDEGFCEVEKSFTLCYILLYVPVIFLEIYLLLNGKNSLFIPIVLILSIKYSFSYIIHVPQHFFT